MWRRKGPAGSPGVAGGAGPQGPPGPPGPPGSIAPGVNVGDIAVWNGVAWVPNGIAPTTGNILVWSGTNWVPTAAGNGVTVSAGGSISANIASTFQIPNALVGSAVMSRSFHYIISSGASGTIDKLGMQAFPQTGVTTVSPTNNDLRTSSPRLNTTSSLVNTVVGMHTSDPPFCRGAAPGVGGFFLCWRFAIPVIQADSIVSIGLNNAVIAGGANPSASGNRVVFGADTADASLTVISTDNVGGSSKSAAIMTKASLATGDPNTGAACVFEAQMYALPNTANIHCTLINRSLGTVPFDGDISSTLPLNTTNLRATCVASTKSALNTQHDFIHFFGYW